MGKANKKNSSDGDLVIPTGGSYDCGGMCLLKVHVKDGVAIRVETDDGAEPQLRACLRGRAYRKTVYHPDRLKYPMKRAGARGEGKFERISWNEALDTVARELLRVRKDYGPSGIFCPFVSGNPGALHGATSAWRLLNMFGGCVRRWGNVSIGAGDFAEMVMYGIAGTGNPPEDIINSRLIIMWAWNPAATIFVTNTGFHLAQAKEAGARIICVDTRFTESAATFSDQWIPIRPGTDAAMMVAMAYVIITNSLHDQAFLDKYTVGFDKFKAYVMGMEDGIPKSPDWAEPITGVPAATIEKLAWEYATTKPAALRTGYGPGRSACGEQFHRAAMTLAAMTGNVGISGGDAGGIGIGPLMNYKARRLLPEGENPLEAGAAFSGGGLDTQKRLRTHVWDAIPDTLDVSLQNRTRVHLCKVWDAILEGKAGGYPTDAKLLYLVAHNALTQLPNTNKGVQALLKPEFIVVHEQFMTPTAKFADILLPVSTTWEKNDIYRPWLCGSYLVYGNKVIEPLYESKSDFQICRELAPRLGISNYDEGKTEDEWLRELLAQTPDLPQDFPDYDTFKRNGYYKFKPPTQSDIRFKKQIEDLDNNPFPTPSGRIEIYSQRLADLGNPKLPPIPKYVETWESINDSLASKYPLQLIGFHIKTRAHSSFGNNPWLRELEEQAVWINSADARARGISRGDKVRVFNNRGVVILLAKVTERIMPGVVAIGEGGWYRSDETGNDRGGCVNVLTRDEYSPGGGATYNTCLVQVQKEV